MSSAHVLLLVKAAEPASSLEPHATKVQCAAVRPGRLGIVASRKTGGSVARSRAKRLLREVFRRHPELLPEGVDVVAIARPSLPELDFATLERELVPLAHLIRKRALEPRAPRGAQAPQRFSPTSPTSPTSPASPAGKPEGNPRGGGAG